jgi:DnaK suppressor protein
MPYRDASERARQRRTNGGEAMRSIKHDLERKRTALERAIHSNIDATRRGDQRREVFKDPYGSASLTHDDEIAATVVDRLARELKEVNRALEEVAAGRYGICRDCDDPISEARLRVMPFAARCVACQARTEPMRRAA